MAVPDTNLYEHNSRGQSCTFHACTDVEGMTLKVAFRLQDANKYVHAEKAYRIENAYTMNSDIVCEVCLIECRVDTRGDLCKEKQHLRKQAPKYCKSRFHVDIYMCDVNVLLLLDYVIPVCASGRRLNEAIQVMRNLLNSEVDGHNC